MEVGMSEIKKCPECGTQNQITNIFCPTCGYCFVAEPEKPAEPAPRKEDRKGEHRLFKGVTVVVIVILGLITGLASFLVSREIERSQMVQVETGTIWKCSECGDTYKKHVVTVEVPKVDSDKFTVETIEGECLSCRYGPEVGRYEMLLESLSQPDTPLSSTVEMELAAAEFLSEHLDLFPTEDVALVRDIAGEEDPRLVERDFEQFAGKPIHVTGKVVASELIDVSDGTEITYLQLVPVIGGQELEVVFLIVYPGVSSLLKGDVADCYLLPADFVTIEYGDRSENAILCIAMFMSGGLPSL
jgi:ribosomal protein L32